MNKLEKLVTFLDMMGIEYLDSKSDSFSDNEIGLQFDENCFGGREYFVVFRFDPVEDELIAIIQIFDFEENVSLLFALANTINRRYNHHVKACVFVEDGLDLQVIVQFLHGDPKSWYMITNQVCKGVADEIEKVL